MTRRLGILVLLAAAALGAAHSPSLAVGPPSGEVAVLLFLDGRPDQLVPAEVAELRRFTTTEFEAALAEVGLTPVPQSRLDLPRRQWRVRSELSLSRGFLQDCHDELGARHLVLANLVSQYGRLQLMVRTVECASGQDLAVAVAEIDLPLETSPLRADGTEVPADLVWRNRLQSLVRQAVKAAAEPILTPPAPTGARPPILMLPASGVASTADANSATTHLFLQQLLEADRWQVIDPALAASTLVAAGLRPGWLGAEARHLLQKEFGAERIILAELISYDADRTPTTLIVIEDDPANQRPEAIRDFALSLRLVNLRQGAIEATGHLYVDTSRRIGWFGARPHSSLLQQLAKSSGDLWQTFLSDFSSRPGGK